ncbi:MAG TPA: hypothetical protein VFW65_37475 [Pseudonocardiaceae bacterium]|nr:hypothetical protein [Pseudonocardiaceae bacterium]
MNDLFDLPPDRELPDATRDQARYDIVVGIRGERRRSRALLPISIAVAAVALIGGAAGLVAVDHPGSVPSAAPGASGAVSDQAASVVLPLHFATGTVSTPSADQLARCAAQNARQPAGRPDPAQWQPFFTAFARGINVIAFHTSSGPLFCELTPTMVTLSAPTNVVAGATAQPTFVTAFGTVAGVVEPGAGFHQLRVKTTDRTSEAGNPATEIGGVFIAANAVHVPAPSLTITASDNPRSGGHQVVVPDAGRLAVAPTQDRPLTPADQSSPAGRRLAECLANASGGPASGGPAVDRAAWVPGQSATLDDHETVQLGSDGDLLAVCTFGTQQHPDVSLAVEDNTSVNPYLAANPYLSVAEVAHAKTYDLIALAGLVKSADVATVTLSSSGKPTIMATVHNGTYVLSGSGIKDYVTPNVDPKGAITVRSASGDVLATLSLH